MADSLQCTSCGAPVEIHNRFSKVLVCEYCGTHLKITGDGFEASGKHAKLAEFPSIFSIGCSGTILNKPFNVLGRMRYNYGSGHYDEWFIEYEGENAWLSEDEGTYTLFTDMVNIMEFPDITSLRAGMSTVIGDKKVMIKEKGTAKIDGGEGELYFYLEPGTQVTYIDGVAEGKKVSIEATDDEIEFFMGRPLLKRDIVVN